jgi:hypothetical protein
LRYVFNDFAEYLPKYYFSINQKIILRLRDCPDGYTPDITGIIQLLEKEKELAVKRISGHRGVGFYKISTAGKGYLISEQPAGKNELTRFLSSLDRHIITEYIHCHRDIGRIYPVTPNAVRIILLHEANTDPVILCSAIRFGTKKSGFVDNVVAGGIVCGIRIETGELFMPYVKINDRLVEQHIHPDTGIEISGTLPHWKLVREKLAKFGNLYPQLVYSGFDIVITEDGFKILEINPFPQENQRFKRFINETLKSRKRV